ncbi:type IV toxin-antitoxin system AbiEi family antitoxin domain-containing protein [Propionibacteriaceae bacterium G57]|uniref:type IV toxin-antitoxin system AbiEi family antitoxin domain-containing protein n=1 Tax=Aestuariimicrobium sp. G57 TaxID=3418485 RepID=UPI003DA6EB82
MDDLIPFNAAESSALGWNNDTLRNAVRRGEVTRLRRGSYLLGSTDDVTRLHLERMRATAPLLEPTTVFSHLSAAVLWGIPLWNMVPDDHVWVTLSGSGRGQIRGPVHSHNCPWTDDEVTVIDGMPVTTPARTVIDLARRWGPDAGIVAADWALDHGLDRRALEEVLAVNRRRPGMRAARMIVPLASPRAESEAESVSRLRMYQLGIPQPQEQVVIRDENGVFVARTDFGWLDLGVLGECDGRGKYDKPRDGARPSDTVLAEKTRERRLRELGWGLVRWMPQELDRPQTFGRMLRRALRITT